MRPVLNEIPGRLQMDHSLGTEILIKLGHFRAAGFGLVPIDNSRLRGLTKGPWHANDAFNKNCQAIRNPVRIRGGPAAVMGDGGSKAEAGH
jgi:hypothetical protein